MKSLKMVVSAATAGLLIGVSGIAMSQDAPVIDHCDGGSIWLKVVDEIVVEGRSCAILDVVVRGNVTATGGQTVSLTGSRIEGDVVITGAERAFISNNLLYGGVLRANDNGTAIVQNNTSKRGENPAGALTVNRNQEATVQGNILGRLIECKDNGSLQSNGNVSQGEDTCPAP